MKRQLLAIGLAAMLLISTGCGRTADNPEVKNSAKTPAETTLPVNSSLPRNVQNENTGGISSNGNTSNFSERARKPSAASKNRIDNDDDSNRPASRENHDKDRDDDDDR